MFELKKKTELNIILFFSIFALASAFFIEYILGHKSCNLCLLQRIPYILVITIIILISIFKSFEKVSLLILSIIFFLATFLAIYHVGIEQGFIDESAVCNLNNKELNSLNKKDLLKELNTKPISCKDVSFKMFGLSLATLNTLISLILAFITLRIFFNYEKK